MTTREKITGKNSVYYIVPEAVSFINRRIVTRAVIFEHQNLSSIYFPREEKIGFEGPYFSLRSLKEKSPFYRKLLNDCPAAANKIIKKENIRNIANVAKYRCDIEQSFERNIWKILQHSVTGEIKNGEVIGIHYYDDKNQLVRIKEELRTDKNGVWEATVLFLNDSTGLWQQKSTSSTFFPKTWTLDQVIVECEHAFQNRTKISGGKNKYVGVSTSGINIVFIIDESAKLHSAYPEFVS